MRRGSSRRPARQPTLNVAAKINQDFTLQVGDAHEKVTVVGESDMIQTATASTGTVIDNKKVVELPLNGRQFYSLALLSPGAYAPAQNSTIGYKGGFRRPVPGRPTITSR